MQEHNGFGFRRREGAGKPPPQQGLALYGYLLKTYAWQLLWLSWVMLLSMLPVVTVPAALTAASRVCIKLVREGCVQFWAEYKLEFRRSFAKSLPLGALTAGGLLASYYLLSLSISNGQSVYGLAFLAMGLGVVALVLPWSAYGFCMLAALDLPLGVLLRNAWYLMLLSRGCTMGVLAIQVVAVLVLFLAMPASLLLAAAGAPALVCYTISFIIYQPIRDRILLPYERGEKNT